MLADGPITIPQGRLAALSDGVTQAELRADIDTLAGGGPYGIAWRLSGNYQIVLTRDGHLDNVEIRVEVQRELSGKLSRAALEEVSRTLQHHIKTIIGISTKIKVMDFDTIPRTQTGKARRVIDERPKQL